MAERGQVSNVSQKNGNHFSFLPSTMIRKCSEGMYVTYTSEIFPDPHSKKQVFVEQCLGLFVAELGLFAILCQAFSLSRSVPSFLLSLGSRELAWGRGCL